MDFHLLGESTLLIEWPAEINREVLREILLVENQLMKAAIPGVVDLNHAYHSLAISFDPDKVSPDVLKDTINSLRSVRAASPRITRWEVPVCYSQLLAPDLDRFCKTKNLSIEETIRIHSSAVYTVYFLGFLPGFMYLGGLDERLHLPRKTHPSRSVPKGAVAIGGRQTGIYPVESPGGWHVIGSSPLSFFDRENDPPCFVRPGDELMFVPVNKQEYDRILIEVKAGIYEPKSTVVHG